MPPSPREEGPFHGQQKSAPGQAFRHWRPGQGSAPPPPALLPGPRHHPAGARALPALCALEWQLCLLAVLHPSRRPMAMAVCVSGAVSATSGMTLIPTSISGARRPSPDPPSLVAGVPCDGPLTSDQSGAGTSGTPQPMPQTVTPTAPMPPPPPPGVVAVHSGLSSVLLHMQSCVKWYGMVWYGMIDERGLISTLLWYPPSPPSISPVAPI